jgi:hypothetical protein
LVSSNQLTISGAVEARGGVAERPPC